jgi:hypothetical protein
VESDGIVTSHLTYEEIESYVDKRLPELDLLRIKEHVRLCRQCATELREIQVFKKELDKEAGQTAAMHGHTARQPLRGLTEWWRALSKRPASFVAGLTAASLLLAIGGVAFRVVRLRHEWSPPTMRAILRDCHRSITVGAGGVITGLGTLPNPYRESLRQVLIARRIDRPDILSDLSEPSGGSASGNESGARDARPPSSGSKKLRETSGELAAPLQELSGVRMLGPAGIVVETATPTFRWHGSQTDRYLVRVYDEKDKQIAQSGWLFGAQQWSVPKPLQRGARYGWFLLVDKSNGSPFVLPSSETRSSGARFRVLGTDQELQLSLLRSSHPHSHLLLGVSYGQMGLLEESEDQLRELQKENPGSQLVAALLLSVQQLRGSN